MRTSILLTVLFFILGPLRAQNANVDYTDLTRRVYWFDINVRQVKNQETKLPETQVSRLGTSIKYGTVEQFDKYLWNNLSAGKGIAVGPFNTYEEAEFASELYNLKKMEKDSSVLEKDGTYYWYLVQIKRYKRIRSLDFERIPARVANGSLKNFFTTMKVSFPYDKIAIGPFLSQQEAEESKRLYRLEE